ncbi:MAG TPA: hypothetical protein VMH84_15530 [Xanthobacteraceae bacterium]|nr:hypothetical protein [Xanthobacteraceae bacterium]
MNAPDNPNTLAKRDRHPLLILTLIVLAVLSCPLIFYGLIVLASLLIPGDFD